MANTVTFSFGKNWKNYAKTITDKSLELARQDIDEWLGLKNCQSRRILDIGSGSGIHSYIFYQANPSELISFDYDAFSVETTKMLWKKSGSPKHWLIMQGSVLDKNFLDTLGKFNIVYAWGVLHHTGDMWKAVENALSLVENQGYFFVSLYTKGELYPEHLALKQRYNSGSLIRKKWMEWQYILMFMKQRIKEKKNPLGWNQTKERGMSIYYDIVDWLGGLPYEVASPEEVIDFCHEHGFELVKIKKLNEGGCSQYLFQKQLSSEG